jgi:alpha-D-xyloside xylohydrolase
MTNWLLREVSTVSQPTGGTAVLRVRAFAAVSQPGVPGWLTGEPLTRQAVEFSLPNLPHLHPPPFEESTFELRVAVPALDTLRITIAPVGAAVLDDDGTHLGIVVDPEPAPQPLHVEHTDREVVLRSGTLQVLVQRHPFALQVLDGSGTVARTAERLREIVGLPMAPAVLTDGHHITLHLELEPTEHILGFGEQFNRLLKNGQRLVLRVEDALGTATGLAYKPVPVWHSTAGYLGFLNTGAVVTADVGHTLPSVLGLTLADSALDLYLVVAASPARRLTSYTALTGRPDVPPLWAFGYWIGRCRYRNRPQVERVLRDMRAHQVPCDVLHLDPNWLVLDRLNTDFIWNRRRFGGRREFVTALDRLGARLSLWELPYIDPASPVYAKLQEDGYLVQGPDGRPAAAQRTPVPDGRPRAMLDFTNPAALAWWQDQHKEFLDDGVAAFKTDFGEGLGDDVSLADGTPPHLAHNLYPLRYNGAVSDAIRRFTGRNPLVWGRSGWAGSQRYPAQWAGDAESTVSGMLATLHGGLSYGMSAPGFWSHDVGGFYGPELTPELYIRWTQFGAMSPLMRAHGLRPREPWAFGPQALEICRDWIRLRYSLLPYLWQVAHESAQNGWPMLRPLGFMFPDDPVAATIDTQFMLGGDLLVVPIFDDGPGPVRHRWYLPAGRWTDLVTGQVLSGGFVTEDVPLQRIPVLVRAGAVVPRVDVDPPVRRTDDLVGRPWRLHEYGATDGEYHLIGFDGVAVRTRIRHGKVSAQGPQPIAPMTARH